MDETKQLDELEEMINGLEAVYANVRFMVVDQTEMHPAHRKLVIDVRDAIEHLLTPYLGEDYFTIRHEMDGN